MLERILNPARTIYKWDRFYVGFLPALFCPLLAFLFFYTFQMKLMSFEFYLQTVKSPDLMAKILSFGCILNLAIFFLFIDRNYYNASRGVIGATLLWALPIIYAKFLM